MRQKLYRSAAGNDGPAFAGYQRISLGRGMFFIDRLLQSRRIVTKVLIFVIPLVVLIAGIGLVG